MTHIELKEKLIEVGIPEDRARAFSNGFRHGFAEYTFEEGYEPTDENFKVLNEYYKIFYVRDNIEISDHTIKSILSLPYEQLSSVKELICKLTGKSRDEVEELYKEDHNIYGLDTYETKYIYELICPFFQDDSERLWQVFKRAIMTGMFNVECVITAIVEAVGEEHASEVLYESTVNGYLFLTSEYLDQPEAIKTLRSQFDSATTVKVLKEHPEYLFLFKHEDFVEFSEQKEKREREVQAIIDEYK